MAADIDRALADAERGSFWLDQPGAPDPAPPLSRDETCDLVVVGAGYTGLWTALLAKQDDPGRDVIVCEGRTAGWAASGRNGGFCAASLTHGLHNGLSRFPDEMPELERLGRANLGAIEATIGEFGIDCGFERTGELNVAVAPHQVEWMAEEAGLASEYGWDAAFLDRDQVQAEVDSPTYLAGAWNRDGCALVDPARLAWGLRAACLHLGVRLFERSEVSGVERDGAGVAVRVGRRVVRASQAVLATNAFRPLLRAMRAYVVPVYDYALMTEPLTAAQLESIGWRHRQGIGDTANQFHYYRLTSDNRILWGGFDAIYYWRNGMGDRFDQRPDTFRALAANFFDTFPQLEGLRFSHTWGGAIDTSTRFFAYQRTAMQGRVAYSIGYTGLGVGATRFGARVMLDLLAGRDTEALRLDAVRSRPRPFPPEPLRYAGIQITRHELARADRNGGRRGLWLKVLDRAGLGFDS